MSAAVENLALNTGSVDATLRASALQAASPIVLALMECDDELRAEATGLFKQLNSGGLDVGERVATIALLAEILFPNSDHKGLPGLDLTEAEDIAKDTSTEAKDVLSQMDLDEAAFADRLRTLMTEKNLTQGQLAAMIGVGQPAISMMLQRNCRPQKRTIVRIAEALGVSPGDLWPNM